MFKISKDACTSGHRQIYISQHSHETSVRNRRIAFRPSNDFTRLSQEKPTMFAHLSFPLRNQMYNESQGKTNFSALSSTMAVQPQQLRFVFIRDVEFLSKKKKIMMLFNTMRRERSTRNILFQTRTRLLLLNLLRGQFCLSLS